MAVKKIKWITLVTQNSAHEVITPLRSEIEDIDNLLNGEDISVDMLKELAQYVVDYHLKGEVEGQPNDNLIWKDMPVYTSSWNEKDRRFILLLKNKLREYVLFYKKILTDKGVQRALSYAKTYENDGNASSTERGTDSATPQNSNLYDSEHPESDALFDKAIADFASSINKNKANSESHSEGGSTTNVTGTTWEEGKKNIQLIFYNELKEYIMSLPDRIYSHYSLETMPAPMLCKKMIEHLEEVGDMITSDE